MNTTRQGAIVLLKYEKCSVVYAVLKEIRPLEAKVAEHNNDFATVYRIKKEKIFDGSVRGING